MSTNEQIEKRICVLETTVASLTRRLNAREKGEEVANVQEDLPLDLKDEETMLFMTFVLTSDPWYVQWLAANDKARGLGFTEEQIEEALNDPRPEPLRGRR